MDRDAKDSEKAQSSVTRRAARRHASASREPPVGQALCYMLYGGPGGRHGHHSHFTDKDTEAQRG